jgi:enoyl-CoA hydratase/carnithine racemase
VSEVTPPDGLMKRAGELAREIAQQPGRILRLAKRLFQQSQGKSLEDVLELSAAYQALCHHSPEHEGAIQRKVKRFNR